MTIKELVAKWRDRATQVRPADSEPFTHANSKRSEEAMQLTDRANEVAAALEVTVRDAFLEGYDCIHGRLPPGLGSPDEAGGLEAWEHSEAKADVEACYPKPSLSPRGE